MWKFISIGCAWMENKESEEIESIENFWGMEEIEDIEEINETFGLKLENWDNYNYIIPDNVEILVEYTEIIEWEWVNLSITVMKDWKKMDNYNGTIYLSIVDENWIIPKSNEYTLPNRWFYTFTNSDWWYKEFQKWLTINKEWTFYIEVQDLMDSVEKILWRQKITVIKKS